MLGEKLIKRQIKIKLKQVLVTYIKDGKDLDEACEGIALVALEIIEIIGTKQFLKLLWYARKMNILKMTKTDQ